VLLHYLTLHKNQKVVFLSVVRVALIRTGFCVSKVAVKRAGCVAGSQRVLEVTSLCLYTCTHAAVLTTSQWLCQWCHEEYGPKCQCFSW